MNLKDENTEILAKRNVLDAVLTRDNIVRDLEAGAKKYIGQDAVSNYLTLAYDMANLAEEQIKTNIYFVNKTKGMDPADKVDVYDWQNSNIRQSSDKIANKAMGRYENASEYFLCDRWSNGAYKKYTLAPSSPLHSKDKNSYSIESKLAISMRNMSLTQRIEYLKTLGLSEERASEAVRRDLHFVAPGDSEKAQADAIKCLEEIVERNFKLQSQKLSAKQHDEIIKE
jgi:hypothetical protein